MSIYGNLFTENVRLAIEEAKNEIINESFQTLNESNNQELVLNKYANKCKSALLKDKRIKSVKITDYKGKSIDILFKESYNNLPSDLSSFIVKSLNSVKSNFETKYKTNFYWSEKVFNNDSLLITLDSDYEYDG